MRRLLAAVLVSCLASAPALASDPAAGKVSKASPKVTWTGAVTSFQSWQTYNNGVGQCLQPSCDTFTLEVADGPAPLKITVESGDSTIIVEVVKPDGSKEQFAGEPKAAGTIKNAANGTYTINVAQNEQTQATHKGTAELVFPAAPAAPAPATAGTAPAAPSPAAAAPATLTLKAGRLSRRALPVKVTASAPVTKVAATLLRGRKVVAKGSLARVDGAATVSLKFKGKPKRGRYTLRVTGVDAQGATVVKTLKLKI